MLIHFNRGTPYHKLLAKSIIYYRSLAHCIEYKKDELIATRKAYGQALADLGNATHEVISLDAEVKNSTFAEIFEQSHPERFFQCFIAEQNMVSMGIGFACKGQKAFYFYLWLLFSLARMIKFAWQLFLALVYIWSVLMPVFLLVKMAFPNGLEDIAL